MSWEWGMSEKTSKMLNGKCNLDFFFFFSDNEGSEAGQNLEKLQFSKEDQERDTVE